jgi:hypothetical protein
VDAILDACDAAAVRAYPVLDRSGRVDAIKIYRNGSLACIRSGQTGLQVWFADKRPLQAVSGAQQAVKAALSPPMVP